jgi:lysine 2,3-aminomutase
MADPFDNSPVHARPPHREPKAQAAPQPFAYPIRREFVEPDWTRLPGYR